MENITLSDIMDKVNAVAQYALITGASHGIGKAIARDLAGKDYNLVLVALPGNELDETLSELKEDFKVDINGFGIDLTQENAPQDIYDYVKSLDITLSILINNAGSGSSGMFHQSNWDRNNYLMKLNNQAVVNITHLFINMLLEQPEGWILNVSSMEGTLPLPYKAVYTSTKAFIYAFSLALNEELKDTNVSVSVLCPGGVVTNEEGLKRQKAMGWRANLLIKSPEFVARKGVHGMLKRKRVITPGFIPKAVVIIMKLMPTNLKMKILERVFRIYKEL